MSAIDVQDLTRRFRGRKGVEVTALDGVSLRAEEGEVVGLLGPNGAGKTTLSRILTTLLLPTSGSARVDGLDVVRDAPEVRKRIGLVLGGERGLYGRLTARQNLRYWGAMQGLSGSRCRNRADELLELLGLAERGDDRVETYSRGMVQRVHLARALLCDPRVLIMDEPTSGMDPHAAQSFRGLVEKLRDGGSTVLLATHDMQEAQALCSRVALIDHGRILREGAPKELLAGLDTPRTLTAGGVSADAVEIVAHVPGVTVDGPTPEGFVTLRITEGDALDEVLRVLTAAGVRELSVAAPTLAEVYRSIIEDREFAL
ncbi:ABC transporter ATP-binding protein [Streptomyces sp. NBC_00199]|uniref:ABC transporter ATP-binding protein n=1 Tax=Streptomyces sp. NBC_00199 TaxID=2975678 RepID=UPI0022582524|nr:ABC transporter ATP-binding protein [Streptomyces sp. NBC_00199]MCX5269493.1 ABC transporter ATP-binding protein [Streptomyces sp. NBC_00199]